MSRIKEIEEEASKKTNIKIVAIYTLIGLFLL
jgi:hypothetical protein